MKRRRKRRASPAPLICLLAVLACIVALRISVSEETAASAQMTGKLENPATTAPVRLLEAEMTEAEQVTRAEDRPARAARYVNIEMTDEELAERKKTTKILVKENLTGYLKRYSKMVSSADKGAIINRMD